MNWQDSNKSRHTCITICRRGVTVTLFWERLQYCIFICVLGTLHYVGVPSVMMAHIEYLRLPFVLIEALKTLEGGAGIDFNNFTKMRY